MIVSIIAAISKNGVIGSNNKIPWKSKEDMAFFKAMTMDCPVIMGRKTWDSLNKKPLVGRFNIVVTSNKELHGMIADNPDGPLFIDSVPHALQLMENNKIERTWIIGGQKVYEDSLSLGLVDEMYLNVMKLDNVQGDAYFPFIEKSHWQVEPNDKKYNDFDSFLYTKIVYSEDHNED